MDECEHSYPVQGGAPSKGEWHGRGTHQEAAFNRKNYRVVKTSARGTSRGFRLLGIIPFGSPSYANAKADLYRSVGQPLEGRAVVLAHQTEDRGSRYLILFSFPKLTLTADVLEYVEE